MPDQSSIDVSILVVSYNTSDLTRKALDSVQAETRSVRYEVIAVDNASSDGSAAMLRAHPAVSKLIELDQNIGFGRANNLAAQNATGRYVLLLNSDTVVLHRAIDKLVTFADQNKQALIWGGRTLFADGSLNPTSVWRNLTPWSLFCRISGLTGLFPKSDFFNRESFGGWRRDFVREVDIVSGCFFLMPRTVWTALGGFDPLFFMYGEEADLCRRAKRIGARPLMTPDATIIHHGGASEVSDAGKYIKLFTGLATIIGRHWIYPLNFAGQYLLLGWPLSRWLSFTVAGKLLRRDDWCQKAALWKKVWNARQDWQFGYTDVAATGHHERAVDSLMARQLVDRHKFAQGPNRNREALS